MWNNMKTVVEEHFVIRKYVYLDSAGQWFDDEAAMYLLTYH